MTQYYRAADGVIAELFTPPSGVDLSDCFAPALAEQFITVPTGLTPELGWVVSGSTLVPPVASPPSQAELIAYAGGKLAVLSAVARSYTVGSGVTIKCDTLQGTGSDLAGLNAWGAANPTATTTWVDDFGVPTTITGAEGVALALAVVAYGQSLYNKLGAVCVGIASSTITTTAEIDAAGWPT